MVDESSKSQFSDPSGAEQAYMAIANLASQFYKIGALKSVGQVNKALAEMRINLSDDEHYKAEIFSTQLNNLKNIVIEDK